MQKIKLVKKLDTPSKITLGLKPTIQSTQSTLSCAQSTELIDLRLYKPKGTSKKTLIIDVMNQLITHTDQKISLTTGDERKKNQFRVSQFRKAISSLQAYPLDITSGSQAKQLDGIGKGTADRIDEILKTGTLAELTETVAVDANTAIINELITVTGIGEVHAKKFVESGVTGVADLMTKASLGQIKITHHMQVGLKYYYDIQKKIPYKEVFELSQVMKKQVEKVHPGLLVEVCGSHRRQKALSGDMDVLVTNPLIKDEDDLIKSQIHYLKDIVKALKESGFIIADLTSQGDTKYMGICIHPNTQIGRRIDIRFVPYVSFFPALLYFTGSMVCNKLMRGIALEKGYTLNEYGLYHLVKGGTIEGFSHIGSVKKGEKVMVTSEEHIFEILGIKYLSPTEREL